MSAHMKKHPINCHEVVHIIWHGGYYAVPVNVIEQYKMTSEKAKTLTVDEVFADVIHQYGKAGVLLQGFRHKEGLSQVEFSKKLGITQSNLSAMENGRRAIGKEMARRIGDCFHVDYRLFL